MSLRALMKSTLTSENIMIKNLQMLSKLLLMLQLMPLNRPLLILSHQLLPLILSLNHLPTPMWNLLHNSLLSLRSHGAAPTDAVFTTPAWSKVHGLAIPPIVDPNLLTASASGAASEALNQINISFYEQNFFISS